MQKGTKDTPERGDSDFPPLWTLPLETAKHRGAAAPLLDVPPKSSIATLLAPLAYFVTPPVLGTQGRMSHPVAGGEISSLIKIL